MSKVVYFIILGGLVIAVVAAVNLSGVNAHEGTKFIPVSVLSKKQANYAADKNLVIIPAVSADILEDKVHDIETEASVRIIRYTSLPVENPESADQDNAQSVDQGESHNNQENNGSDSSNDQGGGNSNQNGNNNGNGNSNQNMNNNGNGNAGSGNNNSNNGNEKEKETKPDKSSASENKSTEPESKPDKVK